MNPNVGFTGTQAGMTIKQIKNFAFIVNNLYFKTFRHGDCIGSDEQSHNIIRNLNPNIKIIIHPPEISKKRAFCSGDIIYEEKPYLDRNKDIVYLSDLLVACPGETFEVLRSGTWSTIRYARKTNKRILILFPDGTIFEEGIKITLDSN